MPAKRKRTWTLISVMALSGVVKVDCVIGAERSRREKGSRWRRGEERGHAGLPTPFYNYVEWKFRNTNFEYLRWPNTVFLYLCIISRYFQTALAIGRPKLARCKIG